MSCNPKPELLCLEVEKVSVISKKTKVVEGEELVYSKTEKDLVDEYAIDGWYKWKDIKD